MRTEAVPRIPQRDPPPRALVLACGSGFGLGAIVGLAIVLAGAADGGASARPPEEAVVAAALEAEDEPAPPAVVATAIPAEEIEAEAVEPEAIEAEAVELEAIEAEAVEVELEPEPEAYAEPAADPNADPPSSPLVGEDRGGGAASVSATLTFDVDPSDVEGLVIEVDDQRIDGTSHVLELDGGRRVQVEARARGYLTFRRNVWVSRDKTVRVRLRRPRETRGGPGSILDL